MRRVKFILQLVHTEVCTSTIDYPSGSIQLFQYFNAQRTIEGILSDLPGCIVYLDDILVTGENDVAHLVNLQRVLQRLEDVGLKLERDKVELVATCNRERGHSRSCSC